MSFYCYLIVGFLGGILGGMGMGGGTILIPLLSLFLGVEQRIAQAINLLVFLPTALCSLVVHKKENRLQVKGLLSLLISALCAAVLTGFFATQIPDVLLRKLFGTFLLILTGKELISLPKFLKKDAN